MLEVTYDRALRAYLRGLQQTSEHWRMHAPPSEHRPWRAFCSVGRMSRGGSRRVFRGLVVNGVRHDAVGDAWEDRLTDVLSDLFPTRIVRKWNHGGVLHVDDVWFDHHRGIARVYFHGEDRDAQRRAAAFWLGRPVVGGGRR